MFHACPTSPHLILFSPEITPTIIMHEDEEQEKADNNLYYAQRIEPFVKTDFHVMLDTKAYEVIVKDKCPVHPAELIRYTEYGNEQHPEECVLKDKP